MTMRGLTEAMTRRGWQAAVVPAARLSDLRDEIDSRRPGIDPATMRVVDRNITFEHLSPRVPVVRSLIVVAVPHPCARLTVTVAGSAVAVPIPTTYCNHAAIHDAVVAVVGAALAPDGASAAPTDLPEKLLAVCAGLAWYGRNNIAYVDGHGSFVELVACVSDLEPDFDPWTGPRALPRCESCDACRRACPTGAIGDDRFLLHGDRCLTLHNESNEPFAGWIDPTWHHCLVGCLRCQRSCPENRAVRDAVAEETTLDANETRLLLAGTSHALLAGQPGLRAKLCDLGLLEYDDEFLGIVVPRNLAAVLAGIG